MKKATLGVVIGLLLGMSFQASANGNFKWFMNSEKLAEYAARESDWSSISFVQGYSAGVSDTLNDVLWLFTNSKKSYQEDAEALLRQSRCLTLRSADLGSLTRYASRTARESKSKEISASLAMIARACEE